jgi:O-antigen/teichoic acid export membrane protein
VTNFSVKKIISGARSSQFLRHNAVFFTGSLVVGALNYIYYPVLGRLMSTSDFGETQALVSLFLQATIFLSVVTNVAVNIVANEKNAGLRNRVIYELEHAAMLITLVALGIMIVFIPQLKAFLQFEHSGPFFILALSLVVSVPGALRHAFLRGRSAFGLLSAASIVGSLAKIIFSAGFVLLGWRTLGAMGGLVAAQMLALAYAAWSARRLGLHRPGPLKVLRWPDITLIRPHLHYAFLVLIVSLVSTMLFSFDIIAVKHYFPAEIAGFYAGIATIARIIYFVTGSIAAVLLSTVKLSSSTKANHALLARSALLQGAIGGSALLMFALAPRFITHLLVGARYGEYFYLLPKLSLALFILSFVSLLFNYDLALRRASSGVVAVLGAIAMGVIVVMHHSSLVAVVDSLLLGSIAVMALRLADSARRRLSGL